MEMIAEILEKETGNCPDTGDRADGLRFVKALW